MAPLSQHDARLESVERCEWLLEYYKRIGASPESLCLLEQALQKALAELKARTDQRTDAVRMGEFNS